MQKFPIETVKGGMTHLFLELIKIIIRVESKTALNFGVFGLLRF